MQVVVDGLLTEYTQTGQGKVVVLLHGWGDNAKTYANLQTQLAKKYCVVSLDLPGFGGTQVPNEVWGLASYANFTKSFLEKLKLHDVYAFVGHSNGGALAIMGLGLGVLESQKLVLIASAGIRDKQKARRLFVKVVAKTGKVATFWLPKVTKHKLQKRFYGAVGSDMLVVPQLQETFKKTVREDVQDQAKMLTLPTLLIYGLQDKATPVLYGRLYKALIKDSKLVVLDNAEHFVHHDQADKTTRLIMDFLK